MRIVTRECQEEAASGWLSPEAARPDQGGGRAREAVPDLLRNDYQRDRDKILHSKAFRRLSHKTQVFLAVEGDHFRTRLTHTLEVSQIARTIARGLGLNEDLTEAIALGHDLGHTPFGHTGEEAISLCLVKYGSEKATEIKAPYHHNEQSLRVADVIENGGRGLNLTAEVREGILHHTGPVRPETLEGRIVAIADRIAYVNHDIDDAIRAGILHEEDLPASTRRIIGGDHSSRIQALVIDMVEHSAAQGDIGLSEPMAEAMGELRTFLFKNVYQGPLVLVEVDKAMRLIDALFGYYVEHIDEVPEEYRAISAGDDLRAVTDYIAGMTDRYATRQFQRIFIPDSIEA